VSDICAEPRLRDAAGAGLELAVPAAEEGTGYWDRNNTSALLRSRFNEMSTMLKRHTVQRHQQVLLYLSACAVASLCTVVPATLFVMETFRSFIRARNSRRWGRQVTPHIVTSYLT